MPAAEGNAQAPQAESHGTHSIGVEKAPRERGGESQSRIDQEAGGKELGARRVNVSGELEEESAVRTLAATRSASVREKQG